MNVGGHIPRLFKRSCRAFDDNQGYSIYHSSAIMQLDLSELFIKVTFYT